jgi:hypothetical protein
MPSLSKIVETYFVMIRRSAMPLVPGQVVRGHMEGVDIACCGVTERGGRVLSFAAQGAGGPRHIVAGGYAEAVA